MGVVDVATAGCQSVFTVVCSAYGLDLGALETFLNFCAQPMYCAVNNFNGCCCNGLPCYQKVDIGCFGYVLRQPISIEKLQFALCKCRSTLYCMMMWHGISILIYDHHELLYFNLIMLAKRLNFVRLFNGVWRV